MDLAENLKETRKFLEKYPRMNERLAGYFDLYPFTIGRNRLPGRVYGGSVCLAIRSGWLGSFD